MTPQAKTVTVGDISISNARPFVLIAGPCALESLDHAQMVAGTLKDLCAQRNIPLIYKTSFDKANRTSATSPRGLGLDKGLHILETLKATMHLPIITDVHLPDHCAEVASVVDVLQIPAFLCRQTDLLQAACATQKPMNIKKGQFLAPWDMAQVAKKCESFGHNQIMLCERGVSFGYNTLISDMRALPIMAQTGYPVIFDATHSVQQPGGQGETSGGQRQFVPVLARAALSVGVAGLFVETHENPDTAPSDGPNMVKLADMPRLLDQWVAFDALTKGMPL
ncbi:MAG: 3-deoxy-8-phosphooctulonate synthase [Alphaproteobacteria bacterium]